MDQFTNLVEGQYDGQETVATLGSLQVSGCAGSNRRQKDDWPFSQRLPPRRSSLRAPMAADRPLIIMPKRIQP